MAYNSNKGNQHSGDIQYENDPNDTQIDFENDFVALKTNGNQAFVVSGSLVGIGTAAPGAHPSGKNDLVIGDQSGHRGATIASGPGSIGTIRFTYATNANNGEGWIDYSNNTKKMRIGTDGLNTRATFNDAGLKVEAGVTGSLLLATGSAAAIALGVLSPVPTNMLYVSTVDNDNRVPLLVTNTAEQTILAATGSGHVIVGGKGPPDTAAKFNVSGSDVDQLISCRSDSNAQVFHVSGSGDVFVSGSLGIGTSNPVSRLDIDSDSLRLRIPNTPANANSIGEQGEIRWDANYLYICVATNTWKRVALSTW